MPKTLEEFCEIPDIGPISNEVQRKSTLFVFEQEKKEGRNPQAVTGRGFDILSGDRQIEVKGNEATGNFVYLNDRNIAALKKEPNFWLYIVKYKEGSPILLKFNKEQVEVRKITHEQWEVKFSAKELKEAKK